MGYDSEWEYWELRLLGVHPEISYRLLDELLWRPEWINIQIVELKEANPHWPYKSRRARLDNILRGDDGVKALWDLTKENRPVYCRHARMKTMRHGPHVHKGPCLRCQTPCIFEMGGIRGPDVDSDAAVHMRFHCMHGHEEQHIVQTHARHKKDVFVQDGTRDPVWGLDGIAAGIPAQ